MGVTVSAWSSGTTTLVTLRATGGSPVHWSARTTAPWLYLSRTSGTLAPGESVTVKVYVDHLSEPSGAWHARVTLAPGGATVTIDGYGTAGTDAPDTDPPAPPRGHHHHHHHPRPTGTPDTPDPDPTPDDPTPTPSATDPTPPAAWRRLHTPAGHPGRGEPRAVGLWGTAQRTGSAGCGATSGSPRASRSSHSSTSRSYPALPISSVSSAR